MSSKIVPESPTPLSPAEPTRIGETEIFSASLEISQVNRHHHLHDMTPTAAEAHKEITRLQYAVPAEEATKQAVQVTAQAVQVTEQAKQTTSQVAVRATEATRRQLVQYGFTALCVGGGFYTLHVTPDAGPYVVGIVAVIGVGQAVTKWIEKKRSGGDP